jgi:hypothetical protein
VEIHGIHIPPVSSSAPPPPPTTRPERVATPPKPSGVLAGALGMGRSDWATPAAEEEEEPGRFTFPELPPQWSAFRQASALLLSF